MNPRPIALLLAGQFLLATPAHAWWDYAWTARKQLVFQADDIPNDQDEMTVLVKLTPTRADYAAMQPAGADLRFVDSDDLTPLEFEIESWNPSGESYIWVKVPQIDALSTTDHIWMYYGNAAATSGQSGAAAWDPQTRLVYHFNNATPQDVISGNNAANSGSSQVNGYLGQGRDFDGNNDSFGHITDIDTWLDGTSTLEFVIQSSDTGNNDPMAAVALTGHRKGSSANQAHVWGYFDAAGHIGFRVGNDVAVGTSQVNDGGWHHVVLQRNGGNGQMRVYVDGNREVQIAGATGPIAPDTAFNDFGRVVGSGGSSTANLNAVIDELRLTTNVYTDGSVYARYKSVSDQLLDYCVGTFWYPDADGDGYGSTIGAQEACVQPPGYVQDGADCDDSDPSIHPNAPDFCDDDGDGVGDAIDSNCDGVGGPDSDEDGDGLTWAEETPVGGNDCTLDSDGDTVLDAVEFPLGDSDGDGFWDIADIDDDDDGIPTIAEGTVDTDADCGAPDGIPNYLDDDSDGDGIPDFFDGTGDYDNDGIPNFLDCNDGGCDDDQDGDGMNNCTETQLGTSAFSPDTDGDSVGDLVEVGGNPTNPIAIDSDGDGLMDALDSDDDNDGFPTLLEDSDGDGVVLGSDLDQDGDDDYLDTDDDGDGVPTALENINGDLQWLDDDLDGDGIPNLWDDDDDNDGIPTWDEDVNGNGDWFDDDVDGDLQVDFLDPDHSDGPLADPDEDGLDNETELAIGSDPMNPDSDGDGIDDGREYDAGDSDGDGIIDVLDPDDDGDGVPTSEEGFWDSDGDGIPNHLDPDSDNDGIGDGEEGSGDSDCDGIVDWADPTDEGGCNPPPDGGKGKVIEWTPGCDSAPSPTWLGLLLLPLALRRRQKR